MAYDKGGFHAGKGSVIGAGVINIMMPPIIDSVFPCPPITMSLCESRASAVSTLTVGRGQAEPQGGECRPAALLRHALLPAGTA